MIALNAVTGRLVPGFGSEGESGTMTPISRLRPFINAWRLWDATMATMPHGPPENTHACDIRSGKKIWEFQSIPQPVESGHDRWVGNSWKGRAGVNVWGLL
jgi:quinoprotein glucose dehydrogenase